MSTTETRTEHVSPIEYALWTIGSVLGGLFVLPGLCAAVGLALAFTRFRGLPTAARWGLFVVGVALIAYQLSGLASGTSGGTVGPVSRVS